MRYDYIVVGSGLFGSIFAYEASHVGKKVLVLEKRNHIGGNCYTEKIENINVHKYGPHIFHTNSYKIWKYINQFSEFNNFTCRTKVNFNNKIYSFPINLFTLYQLWSVTTPEDAIKKLDSVKLKIENPKNLEEWILSQVGEEIYYTFIYGYTKKQWGMEPKELPSFIIKRLPIRITYDDNYFNDKYQGIPIDGYTTIFDNLLKNIDIQINTDFLSDRSYFEKISNKIVYTGKLDELLNYQFGQLDYRSLRFENEIHSGDYQGNAIINFTSQDIPYTRITEHKHFEFLKSKTTVITKEYPEEYTQYSTPYYPINNIKNNNLYEKYKKECSNLNQYLFGGRLAEYKYYDMDQIIGSALNLCKNELGYEVN